MRLIDADALIKDIDNYYNNCTFTHPGTTWHRGLELAVGLLLKSPTIDAVEVVHGRWEFHQPDSTGNRKPKCSVCGEYHLAWWSDYTHCKYCPHCGAKMDGERKTDGKK